MKPATLEKTKVTTTQMSIKGEVSPKVIGEYVAGRPNPAWTGGGQCWWASQGWTRRVTSRLRLLGISVSQRALQAAVTASAEAGEELKDSSAAEHQKEDG